MRAELAVTPEDELEKEEALIWERIKEEQLRKQEEEEAAAVIVPLGSDDDGDDDENNVLVNTVTGNGRPGSKPNTVTFTFPHRARERHFKYRIAVLEQRIKSLNEESFNIEANRTHLTMLMHRQQKKQMELQLEKDRLQHFTGDSITSSVLHGAVMRYDVESFTKAVYETYENCLSIIATSKRQLIEGESRKKKIKIELETCTTELKNRMAAFTHFNIEREKVRGVLYE